MKSYLQLLALALSVAIIDFFVFKGIEDYNLLDPLFQGWSWHMIISTNFWIWVVLFTYQKYKIRYVTDRPNVNREYLNLLGVFGTINEDAMYYVFKSFWYGKIFWNEWLFPFTFREYVTLVILVNVVLYIMLTLKDQ